MDLAENKFVGDKTMKYRHFAQTLAASFLIAVSSYAYSQPDFPQQPIRIVVAAPPGGGTDHMARVLGKAISSNTTWTVIVENKPGAGGTIGTDTVARAKPDGYTLSMAQTATMAINPELFRKLSYDAMKDFTAVATIANQPVVLVVRSNSPYQTVADLQAAHKSKRLTLATAGLGTVGQLVGKMFGHEVGSDFIEVPYRGSGPALQDVVGGTVDTMFATPPGALPLVQSGRLRALAVSSAKRLPLLPDVPTLEELGYDKFDYNEWKVLMAPVGTPPEIVQRINAEVQKALAQPSIIKQVLAAGDLPMTGSVQSAQQFVNEEFVRWRTIVRESGLSKSN